MRARVGLWVCACGIYIHNSLSGFLIILQTILFLPPKPDMHRVEIRAMTPTSNSAAMVTF